MAEDNDPWPTSLARMLAGQGPMPFRDYMAEALYADKQGFYTKRDRRRSQRSTAQIDVIQHLAQDLVEAFVRFSKDRSPHIVDQGPGSGLLMRYVLGGLPERMLEDVKVTFIEPNLARRTRLLVMLQEFGVDGRVVGSPRGIKPGPVFVVAKELVGSFPVHWLERSPEGWREVHVTFDDASWAWEETLSDLPPSLERFAKAHAAKTPEGHRYEANLQARGWLASIAEALDPGVLVVLDRPMDRPPAEGGSIQALRDGEPVSPYGAPGETDISAGVDLEMLSGLAEGMGLEEVTASLGLGSAGGTHLEALALGGGQLGLARR